MTDRVALSPDGRYVATCLANASAASIKVVDIETGAIDDVAPGCGYVLAWSNEPKLYAWDTAAPPVIWTPTAGTQDSGLTADSLVSVAANGDVAGWSSGSPTVEVFIGDSVQGYTLPGAVHSATLSPDGLVMAVSWSPPPDSGGPAFTMITPSQSPTSPQPPIAMETAKGIAESFFTSPDTHGSASQVTDVVISSATLGTETATGRLVWTVGVTGKVTGPDPTEPSYVSTMILLIDAETGDVRVFSGS